MNSTEEKPKYPVVLQTTEGQLLAITARVDTVRVGKEIGKVSHAHYIETLKNANTELFKMLLKVDITEMERNSIKVMLTQYHALTQPKNSFWFKIGKVGLGVFTLGIIALGTM